MATHCNSQLMIYVYFVQWLYISNIFMPRMHFLWLFCTYLLPKSAFLYGGSLHLYPSLLLCEESPPGYSTKIQSRYLATGSHADHLATPYPICMLRNAPLLYNKFIRELNLVYCILDIKLFYTLSSILAALEQKRICNTVNLTQLCRLMSPDPTLILIIDFKYRYQVNSS